jgi:hypothetical protein
VDTVKDLFYFTANVVKVSDIASIASELGFRPEAIESNKVQQLNVSLPGGQKIAWIPIEPLGTDLLSFELPQQERIRGYEPQTGFIVSFHIPSTDVLMVMLKRTLERFGGWVGMDDNTFETVYDCDTLDHIAWMA